MDSKAMFKYLLEDSGDICDDVWVINHIVDAIVCQTHDFQLLGRVVRVSSVLQQTPRKHLCDFKGS
jgi:hypothetical protein